MFNIATLQTMFEFVFLPPVVGELMSYLRYLCLLAHSGVKHIHVLYCVFLFCLCLSCVPYVASFYGSSIVGILYSLTFIHR